MLNQNIEKALNNQLNEELSSSYLYLSMSAYFSSMGLDGFAHWMKKQKCEEMEHAKKFYDYIIKRNGKISLETVEKPPYEWSGILEVFEETLEHEKHITNLVTELIELSLKEKDYATHSFLLYFADEQVEEEECVERIIDALKLINDDRNGIFLLNKELLKREN